MAIDGRDPTTGHLIFTDAGAPDIGVDPTEVSKQANDVGTRIIRQTLPQLEAYEYKRKGLQGHVRDTLVEYVHTGVAWVPLLAFELLRTEVFTARGEVIFDGVFSSRFTNYMIRFNIRSLSPAGVVGFQMRAGGTNATGASDYLAVSRSNSAGTISGASVTANSGPLTKASAVSGLYGEMRVFDPNVTSRTVTLINSHGVGGTSAGENGDLSVVHNPSTAYDGFRLLTSGTAMTGVASVYGLG